MTDVKMCDICKTTENLYKLEKDDGEEYGICATCLLEAKDIRKNIKLPAEPKIVAEIYNNLVCPFCGWLGKSVTMLKGHILGEQIGSHGHRMCEELPSLCSSLSEDERKANIDKRLDIWATVGGGPEEKNNRGTLVAKGEHCIYCNACDKKFTRYSADTLGHPQKCKALNAGWKSKEKQEFEDMINKLRRLKRKERSKLFTKGIKMTDRLRGFKWSHLRKAYWYAWNIECNADWMPANCGFEGCPNPAINQAFPSWWKISPKIKALYDANSQGPTYQMIKLMEHEFLKILELVECSCPHPKALRLAYIWCRFLDMTEEGVNVLFTNNEGGIHNIDWNYPIDKKSLKKIFKFNQGYAGQKQRMLWDNGCDKTLMDGAIDVNATSKFQFQNYRHIWAVIGLKYIIKSLFGDATAHIAYWRSETDEKFQMEKQEYENEIKDIAEFGAFCS